MRIAHFHLLPKLVAGRRRTLRAGATTLALLSLGAGIALLSHTRSLADSKSGAARTPKASAQSGVRTHYAYFAYWKATDGLSSMLGMNNATGADIDVTPTLYNLSGDAIQIPPITIPARQHLGANIADWVAAAGKASTFQEGSLTISFKHSSATAVGAVLTITDAAHRLSFDVPDESYGSFVSSKLEGMWWLPTAGSQYNLAISNTEDSVVEATVSPRGPRGRAPASARTVTLAAHQTVTLSGGELLSLIGTSAPGTAGGVTITHNGEPGALIAFGMVSESATGFSARFPFEDTAEAKSNSLSATHIHIGGPDIPGLPSDASFSAAVILRNTSQQAIKVSPVFGYDVDAKTKTINLKEIKLAPNQVVTIDLQQALKKGGTGPFPNAGLTLNYTGEPGALIAHITSSDQNRDLAFEVPCKDPMEKTNRNGCYPWDISGDWQSVVHVRNSNNETSFFLVFLDLPDGSSYGLPVQKLLPQQEVAIDIRELRDEQVKDSTGRTIPQDTIGGRVTWYENSSQALTGRLERYSPSQGVSSTLSCTLACCPKDIVQVYFNPPMITQGQIGQSIYCQLLEQDTSNCPHEVTPPMDVTAQSIVQGGPWTSENSAVATVGYVSGQGVLVTLVGSGTTNIDAKLEVREAHPDGEGGCTDYSPPLEDDALETQMLPVSVNPPVDLEPSVVFDKTDVDSTKTGPDVQLNVTINVTSMSNDPRLVGAKVTVELDQTTWPHCLPQDYPDTDLPCRGPMNGAQLVFPFGSSPPANQYPPWNMAGYTWGNYTVTVHCISLVAADGITAIAFTDHPSTADLGVHEGDAIVDKTPALFAFSAVAGKPYSVDLTASGGIDGGFGQAGYNWHTGAPATTCGGTPTPDPLPQGLTIVDGAPGTIQGIPTAVGKTTFDLWISDSVGQFTIGSAGAPFPGLGSGADPHAITVVDPITITTTSLGSAFIGRPTYIKQLEATGGRQDTGTEADYTWRLLSPFPSWLILEPTGLLHGDPPPDAPLIQPVIVAVNSAYEPNNPELFATQSWNLSIIPPPPVLTVTSSPTSTGAVGQAYSSGFGATAGTAPYSWSITGLPPGLSASGGGGITGTPTTAGTFTVTARVTDASSPVQTASASSSIVISPAPPLSITSPSTLPSGTQGSSYSQQLTPTGGVQPYAWSLVSGSSLPAGLSMSGSGLISGTPTTAGTYSFTVQVADSTSHTAQATLTLSVTGIQKPATPGSFLVKALAANEVQLLWKSSSGATGYKIYSIGVKSGTVTLLVTINGGATESYYDNTVSAGGKYCYQMTATNSGGESAPTAQQCVTTQ